MSLGRQILFIAVLILTGIRTVTTAQGAAGPATETEWEKTVAAAKKEGKVGVFLYHRENIETAIRVFEKSFADIQPLEGNTGNHFGQQRFNRADESGASSQRRAGVHQLAAVAGRASVVSEDHELG